MAGASFDVPESTHDGAIALQQDLKIVVVGGYGFGSVMVRALSNELLDHTFGSSGVVWNAFAPAGTRSEMQAIALQRDGRAVVLGSVDSKFVVGRFNMLIRPYRHRPHHGQNPLVIGNEASLPMIASVSIDQIPALAEHPRCPCLNGIPPLTGASTCAQKTSTQAKWSLSSSKSAFPLLLRAIRRHIAHRPMFVYQNWPQPFGGELRLGKEDEKLMQKAPWHSGPASYHHVNR